MKVHITHPPVALQMMKNRLDDRVHITEGDHPPEDVQILVTGHPEPDFIARAAHLQAVVIPWAGLPDKTGDLLRRYPKISVHNLHHNASQVAEMALALTLAAAKRIVPMDRDLRSGNWSSRYENVPSVLLRGKTAVVLGYGNIGKYLGEALKGLGMAVLGVRRSAHKGGFDAGSNEIYPPGSLPDLLPRANVLAILLPLTQETKGMIGEKELALLPKNAILVNVGRGPVVDEKALYDALKNNILGSAGIDVWWNYPKSEADRKSTYPSNYPLHELDNIVLSPHRGGSVEEVDLQRAAALVDLLNRAMREEKIPNRVDLAMGY